MMLIVCNTVLIGLWLYGDIDVGHAAGMFL